MPTEAEKRQQQKDAREIRVFLSSTFKDMDNERSHLLKEVFPAIRKVCAERQVAFTEIDLRWGVTEKDAKSGATVEICLREIERCRDFPPFFIGFLGERYGWIPTNDDLKEYWERQAKNNDKETAALAEKIKKAVEQGISVTELEMQLAVLAPDASLDTKAHSDNALFLLRDKSLTKEFFEKPREDKSKPVELDFYDTADGKLDALKERIRESGFLGLDNYKSVKDFGEHIKQHLLKAIDDIFPEDQQVDEWEQLDRAHRVFANHRRENFLPRVDVREQILEAIRERVEKPYLGPVVLTGPSGQGKSALMADLATHLKENESAFELVLEHYVGADGNISLAGWLDRMLHTLQKRLGGEEKGFNIPEATKDKAETLGDWASQAAQKIRQENNKPQLKLVCVVDALDQLESTRELDWLLNETTGADLIVITSVADGTNAREWVEEHIVGQVIVGQIDLPPLDTDARRTMVTETFKRFRKKLESDQVERLASAEQCGSPLFLKLALEDLRLNARHESMAEKVSKVLEAPDAQSLFLTNFLLDEDYNRDQQPDMAVKFMALLGAAYDGLSDQELADLLALPNDPQFENKPRLPQQYLSQLINNFSLFLLNRNGRHAPMHRMFGETALAKSGEKAIREHIYAQSRSAYGSGVQLGGEGFETRGAAQALYQITQLSQLPDVADAQTRLFTDLAALDVPARLADNEPTITLAAMNSLAEQQLPELLKQWLQHISELSEEHFNELNNPIDELCNLLAWVKFAYFALVKGLRESLLHKLEALDSDDKKIADALTDLGFTLSKSSDPNDYIKVRDIYERALAIRENVLGPEDEDTLGSLYDLAFFFTYKGNPEDRAKARRLYEQILSIREKVFGLENVESINILNRYAEVLLESSHPDDREKAREIFERALVICEQKIGEYSYATSNTTHNLAKYFKNYGTLAEKEKARELYERSIVIDKKLRGPNHYQTLTTMGNFANYLVQAGSEVDLMQALTLKEKVLQGTEMIFGPEGLETATTLQSLALARLELQIKYPLQRYEIMELFERAIAIRHKIMGEEDADLAIFLQTYAVALLNRADKEDVTKAQRLLERALAITEKTLPKEHLFKASILSTLGSVFLELKDYVKGVEYGQRALAIRESLLPEEHQDIAMNLVDLATNLWLTGVSKNMKSAVSCNERAAAMAQSVSLEENRHRKTTQENLTFLKEHIEKNIKNNPYFVELIEISKRIALKGRFKVLTPDIFLAGLEVMLMIDEPELPDDIKTYRATLTGISQRLSIGIENLGDELIEKKYPLSDSLKKAIAGCKNFDQLIKKLLDNVDVDVNADKNSKRDVDNADAKTSAIPEANEEVNDEGGVTSMANKKSLLQDPWFLKILAITKKIVIQRKENILEPEDMLLALKVLLKESEDKLPEEIARYKKFGGLDSVSSERLGIQGMADVERKIPISPELKQIIANADDFEAFVYSIIGKVLYG